MRLGILSSTTVGFIFWANQNQTPQIRDKFFLENEERKENQRTREKKSPKSSIRLERLPRTALSVSTRMATAFSFAQTILFSKTSLSIRTNGLRSFSFCLPFSSSSAASLSSDKLQSKKWRQPVASVLELGGVKIAKDGNFDHFPNTGCS